MTSLAGGGIFKISHPIKNRDRNDSPEPDYKSSPIAVSLLTRYLLIF